MSGDWPDSSLPATAQWDDRFFLDRRIASLQVRGLQAERVRAEFARRWDAELEVDDARRATRHWLRTLTYDTAVMLTGKRR